MRLTQDQRDYIYLVLAKQFMDISFKVFLYGSRTDDSLKGGDIDLLVLTSEDGVERFNEKNLDILVELKKYLGQRKIDISSVTEKDLQTIPFFKQIAPNLREI